TLLFYYRDRDAILQAARSYGDIKYENATIRFFPYFTLQVQRKRQSFDEVNKRRPQRVHITVVVGGLPEEQESKAVQWHLHKVNDAPASMHSLPELKSYNKNGTNFRTEEAVRPGYYQEDENCIPLHVLNIHH
ncbi:hypothetical protein NDU88_006175, partial [Pleurodeles waltl]